MYSPSLLAHADPGSQTAPLLSGTGEMATRVREFDWASTPLGPRDGWSDTLVTTVNLLLASRFPISLYWGDEWTLIYNDAYRPFLTNRHPEALGRAAAKVWSKSWDRLVGDFMAVYRDGQTTYGEDVPLRLESYGELKEMFWTFSRSPVFDSGVIRGIFSISHNTTETVTSRRELAMSEERLRLALAASSGVGTWDWDVLNDRMYADENFARAYRVDPAQARAGVPIAAFANSIHAEDVDRVTRAIDTAIRSGQDFAEEYRIVTEDGAVRWLATKGRCMLSPEGEPLRFPGVALDITERKLTEAALLQSEKLAAVGRLASSIAHEINNPLESVTNLLYLARTSEELPVIQEFLDIAERELRRASAITNQTLRFHKQSTSSRPITSTELFENALSLYQGRLSNAGIVVETRQRASRPIVCFDGEIRQVLTNLISNAIDAMQDRRNSHLLLRSRDAVFHGCEGMMLTVADNGPGMPAKTLARIFEPFYTTKGIDGNGLGLWISREIMQRHHGLMNVRSCSLTGRTGTVFQIFLPAIAPAR